MKSFVRTALIALAVPALVFSQIRWRTTHNGDSGGDCQLQASKITITVNPFSSDVEEEATIAARGPVTWGDAATLEIFGEFSFSKGTALRSMMLWNGQRILKAKLKDRTSADSAYEKVVDRDKPRPIVRDPAVIEYLGDDRYRFKIYPVAAEGSRRIRILYTVPLQVFGEGPQFLVTSAFIAGPRMRPTQIPVTIKKGAQASGDYMLSYAAIKKTIQFGALYQLPVEAFMVSANWWDERVGLPIRIGSDAPVEATAFTTALDTGRLAGHYAAVFAAPPDTIPAILKELAHPEEANIEARIVSGDKSYISEFSSSAMVADTVVPGYTDVNGNWISDQTSHVVNGKRKGLLGVYLKSAAPWDSTVYWTVYGANGKKLVQCRQTVKPVSDALTRSILPLVWGAKFSLVEGMGNAGALLGFVDRQMSLLALESDALSRSDADTYAEAGMPLLRQEEIVLNPSQMPTAPRDNIIFEIGASVASGLQDRLSFLSIAVLTNRIVNLTLGNLKAGVVKVMLLDVGGRVVQTWNDVRVSGGVAQLRLPEQAKGCMILRVFTGSQVLQKEFTVLQ